MFLLAAWLLDTGMFVVDIVIAPLLLVMVVNFLSLLFWMVMTCIHLLSLSFAEIDDLLHGRGPHLAHHRPHPRKEIHERPQQPTGSRHDHDLCLITPNALQDRLSYGLGWRQEGLVHSRQVQVHLLHRPCSSASAADTAEDEHRTADASFAVIGSQHAGKADQTIFRCGIDFGIWEADATSHRRDVHNVPLLALEHSRQEQARQLDRPGQIQTDESLDVIRHIVVKLPLKIPCAGYLSYPSAK